MRDDSNKNSPPDINALDGRDPRFDRADLPGNRSEDRKARQLCRQVAEALDYVFSGDARDDLIAELRVVSVMPAPNTSRLLVLVAAEFLPDAVDPQSFLDRLQQQAGRLRCEVAGAINRRKAPTLVFQVVPQ